jgi:hypothetical protein
MDFPAIQALDLYNKVPSMTSLPYFATTQPGNFSMMKENKLGK